jgi:hypothetical protein
MSLDPGHSPLVKFPPLQQPLDIDTQTPSIPPTLHVSLYEQIESKELFKFVALTAKIDVPKTKI